MKARVEAQPLPPGGWRNGGKKREISGLDSPETAAGVDGRAAGGPARR